MGTYFSALPHKMGKTRVRQHLGLGIVREKNRAHKKATHSAESDQQPIYIYNLVLSTLPCFG